MFVADGYIRVFQDVRGKYGSEGDYVMTRPLRGPLNSTATSITHRRLRHHRLAGEEHAGIERHASGMIGSLVRGLHRGDGAASNPHPALKVAAPESPMVDGWMGDDWFHYGAFRQTELRLLRRPDHASAARAKPMPRGGYDDYEDFRRAGSAGDLRAGARPRSAALLAQKMIEHPAYDAFWQGQALDKLMAAAAARRCRRCGFRACGTRKTCGARFTATWRSKPQGHGNDHELSGDGPVAAQPGELRRLRRSGPLKWDGDTALQFRRDVLKPFFDQYLKDGAPKADTPPVFIYNTGENHWDRLKSWPLACEQGCAAPHEAALSAGRLRLGIRQAEPPRAPLRRVRLRSRQAGAVPPAAGALRRSRALEARGWSPISAPWPIAPMC